MSTHTPRTTGPLAGVLDMDELQFLNAENYTAARDLHPNEAWIEADPDGPVLMLFHTAYSVIVPIPLTTVPDAVTVLTDLGLHAAMTIPVLHTDKVPINVDGRPTGWSPAALTSLSHLDFTDSRVRTRVSHGACTGIRPPDGAGPAFAVSEGDADVS